MEKWMNWLLGWTEFRVTGASPEEFLNLCAGWSIPFWNLRWEDAVTLRITVPLRWTKRTREAAKKAQCEAEETARRGLPARAGAYRRRYALLAGAALGALLVVLCSNIIFVVDVTGNETVPTAVILSALEGVGVKPGAYGPALKERELANRALLSLPELSFLSINLYGIRAEVIVREEEKAPEVTDEDTPADIVADAGGIVTGIERSAGRVLVKVGDTVRPGQVLITGNMKLESAEYSTYDLGELVVRARGEVWGRTWRTLSAKLPLTAELKTYTGREKTLRWMDIFGNRVNFYRNSGISFPEYDKITSTRTLRLWNGTEMPLSFTAQTAREYTTAPGPLSRDAAIDYLEDQLQDRLAALLEQREGECLRTDFTSVVQNDVLQVTMLAECSEQLGRTEEREGQTGRVYGDGAGTETQSP